MEDKEIHNTERELPKLQPPPPCQHTFEAKLQKW